MTSVAIQYKSADGRRLPSKKAQPVGDYLATLREAGRRITAANIVDEARQPGSTSPFVDILEWDDGIASESWRRQQVKQSIGALREVYVHYETQERVEQVVYVSVEAPEGREYVSRVEVEVTPHYAAFALADAKRYLIGFRARYQYLTELDGVIAAIDLLELKEEYHLGAKLLQEGEE